jgi:DNA gyrase/topoisomerase IV subunit A
VLGSFEKGWGSAQAEAVLGMTLRRLTGLEAGKLQEEQQQLAATIADLQVGMRFHAVAVFLN